jgi:DNA primase
MARAGRFYREQLKASPRAIDYLKGRGLTGEIAARFGIGYAPDAWQGLQQAFRDYDDPTLLEVGLVIDNEQGRRYDRFRDRIMFPILDVRGNTIGFGGRVLGPGPDGQTGPKYLNSPETPLFEKGRELYGLTQARQPIRDSGSAIVVEGYMDVVSLAQFGVGNAVATLGTATTPAHVQKLLRQADRIVFCFDGDAAGRKAAWRALEAGIEQIADNKSMAFLFLPREHDPDSYVRAIGAERFMEEAARAGTAMDFLIQEFKARPDLATAEGRSRLLHEARPVVERVRAPALRGQLADAVIKLAGLSAATPIEAERLLGLAGRPTAAGMPPRFGRGAPASARRAPPTVVRLLLKILLQKPEWSARLPPEVIPDGNGNPEAAGLAALADAVDHGELGGGGPAAVLEFFRGGPHEALLNEVLGELAAENLDESAMESLLTDSVERLRRAGLTERIAALNAKERTVGLSAEERNLLAELLLQKQNVGAIARPTGL